MTIYVYPATKLYSYYVSHRMGDFEDGIVQANSEKEAYKKVYIKSTENSDDFEKLWKDGKYCNAQSQVHINIIQITDAIFDKDGFAII